MYYFFLLKKLQFYKFAQIKVRFFLRESAKRIIASCPMTIDNYLEASLPLENIKKRKMRNRMKKKIIDYQTNKEEDITIRFQFPGAQI